MFEVMLLLVLAENPWQSATMNPWSMAQMKEEESQEPKWTKLAKSVTLPEDPYAEIHYWPCGQSYPDVHEQTHFVQNWFENSWKLRSQKQRCVYCLKGRIFLVDEPPVTLKQVADAVPVEKRLGLYKTYLIEQQSDRNDSPCSILGEWSCYTNQLEYDGESSEFATQYIAYAEALLGLAIKCPGYDATKMKAFVSWQTKRVQDLASRPKATWSSKGSSSCPSGTCPTAGRRW